jgi:tripartite-type tricarboxylate transporter receptor subunit TctC
MSIKLNFYALSLFVPLALSATPAVAQAYPARAIRLVVPSAPGGGTDILGRMLANKLTEYLGQQVVVDNRAGAGTTIGIDAVAKSAPDGYTLLVSPSTLAINTWMYSKLPYDAIRDLAPLTQIAAVPNALVVHPSVPARSVADLIALAKKQPGSINVGSAGIGTSPHLSLELFKHLAKVDLAHVPYKGSGAAVIAHLSGEISAQIPSLPTAMSYIRANRLRAPDVAKHMANEGAEIVAGTPAQFAAYLKSETEKWGRVIKAAGIKAQ